MSVKTFYTPDWKLIRISCFISLAVFCNYLLWAINSYSFLKYFNFSLLIFLILNFLINKDFKDHNYVRLFFICLLVLSLGSVTTDWDARSVWLFHAKRIFFDNNLYSGFDNYEPELMNAYPLLAPSLSATLAKIVGYWNEIFPKSTNIFVLLPALLVQCSFLKNYKLNLIWLMFILLFSGRILVNGRTDGLVAMYFVSNCLIIFSLFIENKINYGTRRKDRKLNEIFLLASGIFTGITLTLLKNEGFVLMLIIFLTTILYKAINKKSFKSKELIFWIIIFSPFVIWKLMTIYHGVYPRILGYGVDDISIYERITGRLLHLNSYKLFITYLILNEKFILSLIIFSFVLYKNFTNNNTMFTFVLLNVISYYILLYIIFLGASWDLEMTLNSSAHRVLVSIVLAFSFFSIYTFKNKTIKL